MLIENNHNLVIELFQKYNSEFEEFDYKKTLPEWTELLEQSLLLNQYNEYQFIEFSRIMTTSEAHLFVIEVFYYVYHGKTRYLDSEYQIYGVKRLDCNYGNLLIRPETFGDKVSDLFVHKDRDFRGFPKFSKKYYFIDDQTGFGEMFGKPDRLMLIEQFDDLLIEVKGNKLIAKFTNSCNEKFFFNMIQLLKGI
jgi:hypothetical protein